MSRPATSALINTDEQLLVRLAWACEIQNMTQAEAADAFGLTRLRVNRTLRDARARGIVRISINSPLRPCVEIESALARRFGLDSATVAPVGGGTCDHHTLIGAALGQFLSRFLGRKDVTLFGMAWGNTLNMATRFIEPLNRPDLEIISSMGGLTKGSDVNIYEITTRLADLCNAEHSYMTAPIYASSEASRTILQEQQVFRHSIEKIRAADGLAMAAGAMEDSLLLADGLPEDVTSDDLMAAGAVGDIMGYFLDATGAPIDHPINTRVLGIDLADLDALPNVIVAAGGPKKVPIISAVLKRGCVNHLISDEATARAILDLDP